MFSFIAPLLLAQAAPATAMSVPPLDALTGQIEAADGALFWAAFEACDPPAVERVLGEDFRMLHDKGGLVASSRAEFIAQMERECAARAPGGAHAGYANRRLAVPGSRTIRPLGQWGALEEGAHVFFERRADGEWEMVGGARYQHVWRWMPGEGRLRLVESLSYDHGAAAAYPPEGAEQ
ncbi:nuclear transport factor 2 family protein [Pelagerythrobacter aerophilus]|uniref:Nuclear transport factor 2 family protein n=1 Tax=Pelagerythrobacter aerophilus TaxID=2306995 RepID=A0A418NDE2_9SPHN|nr:nuclear transport factor 2 family protein [Pelagerythrobacter aerophilus]RIV75832.1 nuclear transport factor 2 family protein [Pelagerythrobacter aerophilus]